MDQPLEFVIHKLRLEFESRRQEYGSALHASFELKFDVQDGNIVHGILNGIRFKIPQKQPSTQKQFLTNRK